MCRSRYSIESRIACRGPELASGPRIGEAYPKVWQSWDWHHLERSPRQTFHPLVRGIQFPSVLASRNRTTNLLSWYKEAKGFEELVAMLLPCLRESIYQPPSHVFQEGDWPLVWFHAIFLVYHWWRSLLPTWHSSSFPPDRLRSNNKVLSLQQRIPFGIVHLQQKLGIRIERRIRGRAWRSKFELRESTL